MLLPFPENADDDGDDHEEDEDGQADDQDEDRARFQAADWSNGFWKTNELKMNKIYDSIEFQL